MIDIKVFKKSNYYIVVTISSELINSILVEDKIEVLGWCLGPNWGYERGQNRFFIYHMDKNVSKSEVNDYIYQLKLSLEKAKELYKSRLIEHIVIEDIETTTVKQNSMVLLGPCNVIKTRLIDDYYSSY